ncbi:MAG TPA: helix-turn-helix domain-containing protein [Pyrinomonadaceae bacterium]|jgi:predicted transcriptional regulator
MAKHKPDDDQLIDGREPGFYIVDEELIDDYGSEIGTLGVAVYNVLVRHANRSGSSSFPSYQTIADKLGISRTTAINGVKILIEHKLIRKEARTDEAGDAASNNYKILHIKKRRAQSEEVVQNLDHPPEKLIRRGSTKSTPPSTESAPPLIQILDHGGTESVPELDTSNQTHLNQTHTHGARAPSAVGQQKCVCATPHRSKLCDEERIRIASNMPGVRSPERYAMTLEARRGTYDSVFLKRKRELQKPASTEPKRDTSCCPDCKGKGLYYPAGDTPEGRLQGVAKCEHPRLEAELERLEREIEEAKLEMNRT